MDNTPQTDAERDYENSIAERALTTLEGGYSYQSGQKREEPPPYSSLANLPGYQQHFYESAGYAYVGPDVINDSRAGAILVRSNDKVDTQNENEYEMHEPRTTYDYVRVDPSVPLTTRPQVPPITGRRLLATPQEAASGGSRNRGSRHRTWIPWSIVTLVLLCLPLGIPAVILSVQASKAYKQGRNDIAKRRAKAALVLNIVATVLFGILIVAALGGVLLIVGVLSCLCNANQSSSQVTT